MPSVETRYLGGEISRRSLFGGHRNKERTIGLGITAVIAIFLTLLFQLTGFGISAVLAGIVYLGTHRGANRAGSIYKRWGVSRRWKKKQARGMNVFIPVSRRPQELHEEYVSAPKKARGAIAPTWNAYRDWPDGLVGLQWLQDEPGLPGIAWHNPPGEESYFTVVFPILGQVRGLESDMTLNHLLQRFEHFLSVAGNREARQRTVQLVTRVLPSDSAEHEAWVASNLDEEVTGPDSDPNVAAAYMNLQRSYKEVVSRMAGAYTQRHYVVGRWTSDAGFGAAASRRGAGVAGWLTLLNGEIDAMYRRLEAAGLNPQMPLTARGVAAVFRHMQMPSWPIDQAGDIADPMDCYLAESSSWDHTVVTDTNSDGEPESWWHRTAVIRADGIETGGRDVLWLRPLLTGMPQKVIRTVSIQFETIPAALARSAAREDLTSDLADLQRQISSGALVGDDLKVAKQAVEARVSDLVPGTGYHGGQWLMHLQISAPSRNEMVEAIELVQEAAGECGITDVDWLDGWGQAAHATCFPVARGMRPHRMTSGQVFLDRLGGKGRSDALR